MPDAEHPADNPNAPDNAQAQQEAIDSQANLDSIVKAFDVTPSTSVETTQPEEKKEEVQQTNETKESPKPTEKQEASVDQTAQQPPAKSETSTQEEESEDTPPKKASEIPVEQLAHKYESLRGRLVKSNENARFGRIVADIGASAKLTPQQMESNLRFICDLNAGVPEAIKHLGDLARYHKVTPQPVALPEVSEDDIYQDVFKQYVKKGQMDKEDAKALSKQLAEGVKKRLSQSTSASKPVEQEKPVQNTQQTQIQSTEIERRIRQQAEQEAHAEMVSSDESYKKQYKAEEFAKIREATLNEIRVKHQGLNPVRWPSTYRRVFEEQAAKLYPPDPRKTNASRINSVRGSSQAGAMPSGSGDAVIDAMAKFM